MFLCVGCPTKSTTSDVAPPSHLSSTYNHRPVIIVTKPTATAVAAGQLKNIHKGKKTFEGRGEDDVATTVRDKYSEKENQSINRNKDIENKGNTLHNQRAITHCATRWSHRVNNTVIAVGCRAAAATMGAAECAWFRAYVCTRTAKTTKEVRKERKRIKHYRWL